MCSCYAHRNSSRSSGRGEANGGGAMPWILSSGVIGQGGGWRGGVDRGSLPCGARSIQFHCTYIGGCPGASRAAARPDSAVGSSTGTGAALALRLDDSSVDSGNQQVDTDDVDPDDIDSVSSDCESSVVAGANDSPSSLELLTGSVINRPGEFGIN